VNKVDGVEIVVVEDDPNDAELIMRVLKKHNLANKVVLLTDGEQALEFLAGKKSSTHVPKVVLLDIKLPKVDGIEVLKVLKADDRTKNIPVVILTSSREERDVVAAYELGVNSYVTKPIKFDDFAKAVSELGLYWMLLNKSLSE
jgi:CheY-like chemotaxis protein